MLFLSYCLQEWRLLVGSRLLRFALWWLPLFACFLFFNLFTKEVPRQLDVAVVDLDKTSLSRSLVRYYDASPSIHVVMGWDTTQQANAAMSRSDVYAVVTIPENFERDVLIRQSPDVHADYNGLYMLIGKTITSGLSQAHATFQAQLTAFVNLAQSEGNVLVAQSKAAPIRYQIQPMFNMANNYATILVPSLFVMVWQLSLLISGVLSFVITEQTVTLETAFGSHPILRWLAKIVPLFLWGNVVSALLLFVGYRYGHWPMYGSFWQILAIQSLAVFVCLLIASFIYLGTKNDVKALGFAGMFAAPSLAYMGVTFPESDMSAFANFWHGLMPSSHVAKVILQHGRFADNVAFMPQPWIHLMMVGLVFFVLVFLMLLSFKAKLNKRANA